MKERFQNRVFWSFILISIVFLATNCNKVYYQNAEFNLQPKIYTLDTIELKGKLVKFYNEKEDVETEIFYIKKPDLKFNLSNFYKNGGSIYYHPSIYNAFSKNGDNSLILKTDEYLNDFLNVDTIKTEFVDNKEIIELEGKFVIGIVNIIDYNSFYSKHYTMNRKGFINVISPAINKK